MNLTIYLSSYVIIILSLLGYGLFFQKILRNSVDIEFEYNFLGSLFFLTFLSYLTHFFFKHGFVHNTIIIIIGIISFIFHLFKNKEYVNKTRAAWTNQFWQDIKEMGGTVSFTEGECEVEYSPKLDLNDFNQVE